MPLAQYFSVVGGVLLAALFILDAWFPKPPAVEKAQANLPIIRIHSDRKWPERVVYDTSLPTIVPASIASASATARAPETIAAVSASTRVREAFAMFQTPTAQLRETNTKAREPKLPHHKLARKRTPAPRVMMARHFEFDWFGRSFW
jgi:hypothetical protein